MDFKELVVFKKAFAISMQIFEITKSFPKEEKYALTDQIRRSSRSVCAQLAEASRKRMYEAHFVSKITDADAENSETVVWIDFAYASGYIDELLKIKLVTECEEIGKLLGHMIRYPEKYRGAIKKIK